MTPKQTSLFDFFEEPVEEKQPVAKPIEVIEPPTPVIMNVEPVDLDFIVEPGIIEPPVEIAKSNTRGRKKLTDPNNTAFITVPEDEELFQKKYYGIGLVAEMFKVNISLIRFWEKEFDVLKPKLNGKGDRHFRPEDVKNLKLIYHLLREKKYTIEGAREFLKINKKSEEVFGVIEQLQKTKAFLTDLKLSL
jgi:DNA-binding transcriptional MerR regulator